MNSDDTPNKDEAEPGTAAEGDAAAPAKKPAAKKKSAPAKKAAAKKTATTPEEKAAAAAAEKKAARRSGDVDVAPVRAVARYLRFSAQKGRLVVDLIRGKSVADAATILKYCERSAATEIAKVLKSAVANAENNHELDASELTVVAAWVDEGPTFKRWKPRARGSADRINKRTCHVTIQVGVAAEAPARKSTASSGPARGDRAARVAASKSASRKPAAADAPTKKASKPKAAAEKKAAAPAGASDKTTAADEGTTGSDATPTSQEGND